MQKSTIRGRGQLSIFQDKPFKGLDGKLVMPEPRYSASVGGVSIATRAMDQRVIDALVALKAGEARPVELTPEKKAETKGVTLPLGDIAVTGDVETSVTPAKRDALGNVVKDAVETSVLVSVDTVERWTRDFSKVNAAFGADALAALKW